MPLHIRCLLVTLSTFVLCACNAIPLPSTSAVNQENQEAIARPSPSAAPLPMPAIPKSTGSAPSDVQVSEIERLTVTLQCTNYLETQWGTRLSELGLCPASSSAWIRGPYPPRFDEQGNLLILDKANERILRFVQGTPTEDIPLPDSYFPSGACDSSSGRTSDIAVSKDRLFVSFSLLRNSRIVDQLAVLSLEGHEQKVIDLEPYYPMHSPYLNSLVSDARGGVYLLLPPAGLVHFDSELRSEFKYLGDDESLLYENLVAGWDDNLYTYSVDRNVLNNWGADNRGFMRGESLSWMTNVVSATNVISPTSIRLLGVDTQGEAYFRFYEPGTGWMFMRMSPSGHERTLVTASEEEAIALTSLAPDGSLFGIKYNPRNPDPAVGPKIIKCTIDRN